MKVMRGCQTFSVICLYNFSLMFIIITTLIRIFIQN